MVAPQFVGTATTFASVVSGATIVLDKPSGLVDGDLLVAVLRTNGSSSPSDFALSGWTRRGYTFVANDAAGRVTGIFTHPVTTASSEPANYTFTKSVSDTRRVGAMFIVRGVDLSNPVAGNSTGWDATPTPRVQLNSFTVDTSDTALLVYAWANEIVSPNATAPTILPGTEIALVPSSSGTGATRTTIWAGYESNAATATGHKNLTWATATSGPAATGVVLRGLAGSAGTATGTLTITGTATANVAVTRTATGSASITGSATRTTGTAGFASVAQMLATPGATWAHRGGSANWPEMSKYAYDQAVQAGYGALEFSANRTSDGVWVGVHDASLNRTSQTTGLPDISTMTWAQVQTYQNTLNSAGTPRPYYRLDQFLDDYTGTHVAIVDPKYAIGTYNTEFLNLLDAHGGNTKIVVKFYGVGAGATGLADAATARGYQTWGYFYDTDVTSGGLAADQSHWSILGMNYDAAQSAWDAVLSYAKPVVGHIAASQANYNTAISRGARMVQCSNVSGITAVGASTITATGGLTVTGSATRALSISRTATGGLVLTGSGTSTTAIVRTATGGLTVVGGADPTIAVERTAGGILELDGTGDTTTVVTRTATGTLTITGVGAIETPPVEWPTRLTLDATIDTLNLTATVPTLTLEAAW
ncbi:glycerophosphodiester phosphodiesterase family protein [Microbacterium oxydans]|uniref:glycerophosphodiester phosphodiesterase family protein n=1 Tax=Microbacterium oxydans TaxID=82380 RepID=UPI0037CA98B7